MSYILDAIKKTESGSKDGDVPNLNSKHQHTAFVEHDESKRWLIPMLVVISILLSIVIWLLLKPASPEQTDQAVSNVSSQASLNTTQQSQPPLSEQSKPQVVTESTAASSEPSAGIVENQSGVVIRKAPLEIKQPVVQMQPQIQAQKSVETISTRPVTEVVQDSSGIQKSAQLSQSVNAEPVFLAAIEHDHWPTLIYTTHIYATDPADRFVMLNGKAYSIGDTISKGMVVADILENDLLVEYQGQKVIVPGLTDVNP